MVEEFIFNNLLLISIMSMHYAQWLTSLFLLSLQNAENEWGLRSECSRHEAAWHRPGEGREENSML